MAEVFHYGYDSNEGWRRLRGPTNLDYRAILDGFGLFDVALALGFVGHQFAWMVLGVVATPFAAVLAFVDPGLAKNADCGNLTDEAAGKVAQPPPPEKPHAAGAAAAGQSPSR